MQKWQTIYVCRRCHFMSPLDGVFQTVSIDGIAVGAIHEPITPVYTWSNFERVKRGEEVEEEDGSNANQ